MWLKLIVPQVPVKPLPQIQDNSQDIVDTFWLINTPIIPTINISPEGTSTNINAIVTWFRHLHERYRATIELSKHVSEQFHIIRDEVASSVSSYITPKAKSKLLESLEQQEIKIANIATIIGNHHKTIEEYIKNTQQKIQFRWTWSIDYRNLETLSNDLRKFEEYVKAFWLHMHAVQKELKNRSDKFQKIAYPWIIKKTWKDLVKWFSDKRESLFWKKELPTETPRTETQISELFENLEDNDITI